MRNFTFHCLTSHYNFSILLGTIDSKGIRINPIHPMNTLRSITFLLMLGLVSVSSLFTIYVLDTPMCHQSAHVNELPAGWQGMLMSR